MLAWLCWMRVARVRAPVYRGGRMAAGHGRGVRGNTVAMRA